MTVAASIFVRPLTIWVKGFGNAWRFSARMTTTASAISTSLTMNDGLVAFLGASLMKSTDPDTAFTQNPAHM